MACLPEGEEMRTLDEVIKAFEYTYENDPVAWTYGIDALHYLKTIETTENMYHDAVNELSKWIEEDWKDRCLPLTWDELKQMKGKPVWVEWQDHKEWFLIDEIDDKKIVFRACNGFDWYCNRNEPTWKAYRKERE